ncbi:FAD-dependent oxidoreductase [Microbacterium testaceum]|uniref:FAD-dependent oxidoreductase n=1 Tax=Microbacterium testaceum TaxID=2033 RepID=A0A147F8N3_MICTE|nr:FAD-dependent oxidoreductase [Microbacterium testaceum]KTS12809.1 FAD-dependent oxidoreductase [Microbacterium testaceum]KTS90608.1 FAD-dependent oxidoreductase [Microbacterium testaceum]
MTHEPTELDTPILIVGGGLGGMAAALAAARHGVSVVITEHTGWLGGALTTQMVPLDEHRRIERIGANGSYRRLREELREHYRRFYPLTDRARRDPLLNPGAGWVSPLCVEPLAAVSVLESMIAPYRASGLIRTLMHCRPTRVETTGDRIDAVEFARADGSPVVVRAEIVLDATETGDLLELGGIDHVTGKESQAQTGEPHAAAIANPDDMQSGTWCFAIEHLDGEDHTIDRPEQYDRWRDARPPAWSGAKILDWTGPGEDTGLARPYRMDVNPDDDPAAINVDHRFMPDGPELWTYRRIAARRQFREGFYRSDITVVNWPMNDYTDGPLLGPSAAQHRHGARQLSLSLLYWLQTEAPRPDGGTGYPGMRILPHVSGTADGLAMEPYIREGRRILALETVREQDVSVEIRGDRAARRYDSSVGVGHYYWLDRHATTGGGIPVNGRPQPFEIPFGALVPRRVRNLLAAGKNIGTTHITNGCYRLHPVEWAIGEAAGHAAAFSVVNATEPHAIHADADKLAEVQARLVRDEVELHWPEDARW